MLVVGIGLLLYLPLGAMRIITAVLQTLDRLLHPKS